MIMKNVMKALKAAVSGAVVKSTPGQVLSNRAFDADGKPLRANKVSTVKGAAKARKQGTGSAGVTGADLAALEAANALTTAQVKADAAMREVAIAHAAVSAAKPVKLTKTALALNAAGNVSGFDLSRWGLNYGGVERYGLPPVEADIVAAQVLMALSHKSPVSLNTLMNACNLGLVSVRMNADQTRFAIGPVTNGGTDVKINCARDLIAAGHAVLVDPVSRQQVSKAVPICGIDSAGRAKATYTLRPAPGVLNLVRDALAARGLSVPWYMLDPAEGQAVLAAETETAAKKAEKAKPAPVKGATKRKPVKAAKKPGKGKR